MRPCRASSAVRSIIMPHCATFTGRTALTRSGTARRRNRRICLISGGKPVPSALNPPPQTAILRHHSRDPHMSKRSPGPPRPAWRHFGHRLRPHPSWCRRPRPPTRPRPSSSQNIQRGLALLNNKTLTPVQKRDQFEQFLTGLTDLKRIADFTAGPITAAAPAPPTCRAFEVAFQNYAVAVYQYYFSRYSGQTLEGHRVPPSGQPTDYIVATQLVDPAKPGPAAGSGAFRVRTDGARGRSVSRCLGGGGVAARRRASATGSSSPFAGQQNNARATVPPSSHESPPISANWPKQFKS